MSQANDKMFEEALSAIREGENQRAKDLLTRLLRTNQSNADYWLWMSAVVDNTKEQRYCLNQVLQLDPDNKTARRGLSILGDLPPDERQIIPYDAQKRKWAMPELPGLETNTVKLPFAKMAVALVGVILAITTIVLALNSTRLYIFRNRNVAELGTAVPTQTFPVTHTATLTATPDYEGPPPPWADLKATFTPTPNYVNTPHVLIEAYGIAIRAFEAKDYEKALNFFEQALESDSESADIYYYLGETHRMMESYTAANTAYQDAIAVDSSFAPVYVARAKLSLDQDEPGRALADLEKAVELDENYGEAYLELAKIQIQLNQIEDAEETLVLAEEILPDSALIPLAHGQLALAEENYRSAIRYAEKAAELDVTNLDAYRLLGQALQGNGQIEESLEPLYIYTTYSDVEDPQAVAWLARAYAAGGFGSQALEILDEAIKENKWNIDSYLQRGQIYMDQKNYDKAVDDFEMAAKIYPTHYEACMQYGIALLSAERPGNAYQQISECEKSAETDTELARMFFYRALALEALENDVAKRDWERMLELGEAAYLPEWEATAQAYLLEKHYTATPQPSNTARPSRTITPTRTSTPVPTDNN